eukprot:3687494-Pyramimonas_sp.AAC.1
MSSKSLAARSRRAWPSGRSALQGDAISRVARKVASSHGLKPSPGQECCSAAWRCWQGCRSQSSAAT